MVSIDWNAVRAAGIQRLGYPVPVTSPVLMTR
jgi:hypothetical protein